MANVDILVKFLGVGQNPDGEEKEVACRNNITKHFSTGVLA